MSVFNRLTDQQKYTGVYAQRFKSGGGINGHADSGNVRDLSCITRSNLRNGSTHFSAGMHRDKVLTSGLEGDTPATRGAGARPPSRNSSRSPTKSRGGDRPSVFDRLNDKNTFTGMYASRFAEDAAPAQAHAPAIQVDRAAATAALYLQAPPGEYGSLSARTRSRSPEPSSARSSSRSEASPAKRAPGTSVFDRLNNPATFTGVYSERFKSGDGRINMHVASGGVRDLSQITRQGRF